MQYIITAYDGENALHRRMAARPRHLEDVKPSVTTFSVLVACWMRKDVCSPIKAMIAEGEGSYGAEKIRI